MYSLQPTANTPTVSAAPAEPPLQQHKPPSGPQMYFNPQSQRWISTSCRKYREILRDRALVNAGLPPGPATYRYPMRREKTTHQNIHTTPTQHRTLQQKTVETHQQPIETSFVLQEEAQEIEVEDEAQKKTNALWKRYGF